MRLIDTCIPVLAGCLAIGGGMAASAASAPPAAAAAAQNTPPGFTALFDGRSLDGWQGDPRVWSVVDGAIVGRLEGGLGFNTFLIHGKPYENFELRFKYRWKSDDGNSGVHFRSHPIGNHFITGLQANVAPVGERPERFGMLYDEAGDRQEMVLLGQRAEITRETEMGGVARIVRTVREMVNAREDIIDAVRNGPEWTEVVVVAYDDHIVSAINGMLAFDALDKDPRRPRSGVIGLQFHHRGGWIEYKDIAIKPLDAAPDLAGRFRSAPRPAPEPRRTYKESTRPAQPDVALTQ